MKVVITVRFIAVEFNMEYGKSVPKYEAKTNGIVRLMLPDQYQIHSS